MLDVWLGLTSFSTLQREELSVEFDPEVAELLLVGMVVTGTYNLLSDGTWCFTQVRTGPLLLPPSTHHSRALRAHVPLASSTS